MFTDSVEIPALENGIPELLRSKDMAGTKKSVKKSVWKTCSRGHKYRGESLPLLLETGQGRTQRQPIEKI